MRTQPERELVAWYFFEHPLLEFDDEDLKRLAHVLRMSNQGSSLSSLYVCKQHDLAGRAFARATGWSLPATIDVQAPEGVAYPMLLMEVYLEDCLPAGRHWCAAGYRLDEHGAPQEPWQEVPLNWVHARPVPSVPFAWLERVRTKSRLWLRHRLQRFIRWLPDAEGVPNGALTFAPEDRTHARARPSRWLPL